LRTSRVHRPHRKIPRTPSRPVTPAKPHEAPPAAPAESETSIPPRRRPQRTPDEGFVAVGRVLGPFGLKGELKVQPLTDNPRRLAPRSRLWADGQKFTVSASREAQGFTYITLKGFRDRTSVERLRHALLQIPESDLPPLGEGEFYRYQLIGLLVVNRDGEELGVLEEIIETGANDVYRVRGPDGDLLLPALDDVIANIDLGARRMVVDPPPWR
jgi:16S rRNA processing protein RimM